jgi:hypothetical protein
MKFMLLLASCFLLLASGCASVQGGSDKSVTIRHGTLTSFPDIQAEADGYCRGYGKTATFRSKFNGNTSIFDCQ